MKYEKPEKKERNTKHERSESRYEEAYEHKKKKHKRGK
jgi:hypothetical protein